MNPKNTPLLLALASIFTVACDRTPPVYDGPTSAPTPAMVPRADTKTLETTRVGSAIDRFESSPTAEHAADVKKALADLDSEIAELEQRVATTSGGDQQEAAMKLKNLQSYRAAEGLRFTKAQAGAGLGVNDARDESEKVQDGAAQAGDAVERAARKVGEGLEDAADKLRDAVR